MEQAVAADQGGCNFLSRCTVIVSVMKLQTVISCCILTSALTFAQDAPREGQPGQPGRPGGPGGSGGQGGGPGGGPGGPGGGGPRFVPPLMQVLDANRDGIIDQTEIANASMALKKLDRNADGRLTPEELRPPPREGRGPAPGPGGAGGPGPGERPNRPPGAQ